VCTPHRRVPLAEEGDGGEDGERGEVAVDAEDDLVHAGVQDGLGEDVVAAEGELDEDHPGVRPPCRDGAEVWRAPLEQRPLPLVALISHLQFPPLHVCTHTFDLTKKKIPRVAVAPSWESGATNKKLKDS